MIYIITACSRPQNLEKISETIPPQCSWIVVYDNKVSIPIPLNFTPLLCEDTGIVGVKAQNFALDTLPLKDDDFIFLLDDDTIVHKDWYSTIKDYLSLDFSILTWGQIRKSNRIYLKPTDSPAPGKIDTGSFLISWKYNKHVRHIVNKYQHDGIYARECSKNGPVICIDKYISYYNYLR